MHVDFHPNGYTNTQATSHPGLLQQGKPRTSTLKRSKVPSDRWEAPRVWLCVRWERGWTETGLPGPVSCVDGGRAVGPSGLPGGGWRDLDRTVPMYVCLCPVDQGEAGGAT